LWSNNKEKVQDKNTKNYEKMVQKQEKIKKEVTKPAISDPAPIETVEPRITNSSLTQYTDIVKVDNVIYT